MIKYIILTAFIFLSACGGDDDNTSTNSGAGSNEPAPTSFTSRPTDDQLLALIKQSDRYDIKLAKGNGWNTTRDLRKRWHKNYFYTADANIDEFPEATVLVTGEFRFQINGSNYDLDDMRPVDNQYFGLPLPSDESIIKLLNEDLFSLLHENNLVGEVKGPSIPGSKKDRKVKWTGPNAFKMNVDVSYSKKHGVYDLETYQCRIMTRFVRKGINDPFNQVIGDTSECETIEVKTYTEAELRQLKSHEELKAEKASKAMFSKLKGINIPQFKNDKEVLTFIYQTLYTADEPTAKAMLYKMLSPELFADGSTTQLSFQAQEMIDQTLKRIYQGEVNFQNSYCPEIFLKSYQSNYAIFPDALNKKRFRVIVEKINGQFKIDELDLYVITSDRDLETFHSKPLREICEIKTQTMKTFDDYN